MRRHHLLEIHEQPWCPAAVRSGATDCLRFIATVGRQYQYVLPKLQRALAATDSSTVIDLCSGSGGPWPQLARPLQALHNRPLQIVLTDRYPPVAPPVLDAALLRYLPTAVDATQTPPSLVGLRTLFTAFHHFDPPTAQAILQDAVNQGQGIAIFEQTRRHPLALLLMALLAPLAVLITPFIWPWRPARFFWTYLVPAIPLVLCWDGMVSCLRTYTVDELQMMTKQLTGSPYHWEIGHAAAPLSPLGVLYAIGHPRQASLTN
jgi:hypothetical protein